MSTPCKQCNFQNVESARFCLQCGAMVEQAPDPEDPLVGRVLLRRYRIKAALGEGGMGKVYLAEQKMGNATRDVAIKSLRPEFSNDPQVVARFHRECQTVIELRHPNTVQFFDFDELEDKTLIIVMELIEGEDLSKVLERGAIDPLRAQRLVIQICGSLHEAHGRGIVHRDLKPENVLLTERGGQTDFVKVLDFGIAKRSEAEDEKSAKLTKQGTVLGTPPYMSPEQFSGQALDLRSDIYSLGMMTYEMVTGTLPFSARTPWEWATKHLTAQPTPLSQHPAAQHMALSQQQAIMRAIQKDPEARQQSALEFMHEFTGQEDPQSAWTYATSGMTHGRRPQGMSQPHQPISQSTMGPPSGSHQSSQSGISQPGISQQAPMPQMGQSSGSIQHPQHTPAPMHFDTGSSAAYAPAKSSSSGWLLGIIAFLGVVLLGGGAGALWWFTQDKDDPVAQNDPPQDASAPDAAVEDAQHTGSWDDPHDTPTEMTAPIGVTMEEKVVRTMRTMRVKRVSTMMTATPSVDLAQVAALVGAGKSALTKGHFEEAAKFYREAKRMAPKDKGVSALKRQLGTKGGNAVGNYIMRNDCSRAQKTYRILAGVGAAGPSKGHFGDYCKKP